LLVATTLRFSTNALTGAKLHGSRAIAALLLSLCLVLPACGAASGTDERAASSRDGSETTGQSQMEETRGGETTDAETAARGGTTVETLTPEDVLSEDERAEAPKYQDFFEPSDEAPQQAADGGSAGAIPAVKPFNFGRDPGGPADKTMYLTVPKLGLEAVPVFDSVDEEKLEEGVIHVPATGFPWQAGANTYIAGHRIGYPGTRSDHVFYELDQLVAGDEIILTDSAGGEYVYVVTGEQQVVPPDNVEVMNAVEGRSIVTLQTCTLPDYAERIVVQGELI
jgi:sortase A